MKVLICEVQSQVGWSQHIVTKNTKLWMHTSSEVMYLYLFYPHSHIASQRAVEYIKKKTLTKSKH